MSTVCREGHVSDEPDYCSVCGAAIAGASAGSARPAATRPPGTGPIPIPRSALISSSLLPANCPACGEPREDASARFCEVCRYDFLDNRPGPPPKAQASAPRTATSTPIPTSTSGAASTPAPVSAAPVATSAPSQTWELVIAVDPSLDVDPDPANPCPKDRPEAVILVDKPEMLVGRHDETRSIHPEVSLHDPGASRRHVKFVAEADGGLALQDLASTNGTQVNGQDVPAGTRRRLNAGDAVTVGRWTRITVRGRT